MLKCIVFNCIYQCWLLKHLNSKMLSTDLLQISHTLNPTIMLQSFPSQTEILPKSRGTVVFSVLTVEILLILNSLEGAAAAAAKYQQTPRAVNSYPSPTYTVTSKQTTLTNTTINQYMKKGQERSYMSNQSSVMMRKKVSSFFSCVTLTIFSTFFF